MFRFICRIFTSQTDAPNVTIVAPVILLVKLKTLLKPRRRTDNSQS